MSKQYYGRCVKPSDHWPYPRPKPDAKGQARQRAIRRLKESQGCLAEQKLRSGPVTVRQMTEEEKIKYGVKT